MMQWKHTEVQAAKMHLNMNVSTLSHEETCFLIHCTCGPITYKVIVFLTAETYRCLKPRRENERERREITQTPADSVGASVAG